MSGPQGSLDPRLSVRWRLVLGAGAQRADSRLVLNADGPGGDVLAKREAMDKAMAFVYEGKSASDGKANLSAPEVYLPRWLDLVRTTFPPDVVTLLFHAALEKRGLTRLLLEPESLESLEPDARLVAALLSLKDLAPDSAKAAIRDLVQRLVDALERKVRQKLTSAVRQGIRRLPMRKGSYRTLDWGRTLRRNLRHYNTTTGRLVPEKFYFRGSDHRTGEWHLVILVDQSGSMAESVIHAAVAASVLASVRSLTTSLVLFGTEVADMTPLAASAVNVLLGAQIGGGTDIAGAVRYASDKLVKNPARTLFILVTDLYEGGDEEALVDQMAALNQGQCRTLCVLAINSDGRSDYNEKLAGRLAEIGTPSFSASPEKLVDLVATLWGRTWPPTTSHKPQATIAEVH